MTYRIQVDLSFVVEQDAIDFKAYVEGLKDKLYVPSLAEVLDTNAELWTRDRLVSKMQSITDYDDEGLMKGGVTTETKELVVPITKATKEVV